MTPTDAAQTPLLSISVMPDGELRIYPGHDFTEEHVDLMVEVAAACTT